MSEKAYESSYPEVSYVEPADRQLTGERKTTALPLNSTSAVVETFRVVKAGVTIFYGATMTNANASTRFLQAFDANALPANGAIPVFSVPAVTLNVAAISYTPTGRVFDQGCILAISTTQNALTLAGADALFDAQYV